MPGYTTKQENIPIAQARDLIIRSLLDREQFSDPLGIAQALGISSAAWPMFGLLWPSGSQLADRIAARELKLNETMLEMGCGLGLASLVAHRRGIDVTASDVHPLAEAFLLENLRLNELGPMKYFRGSWQEPVGALEPETLGRFDFLVGSDLLYERDEKGVLANYVDRHATDQAQVWIIDPDRGNRSAFKRCMSKLSFRFDETKLTAPLYKGRLLTFTRA